jgi:hypothetical protein
MTRIAVKGLQKSAFNINITLFLTDCIGLISYYPRLPNMFDNRLKDNEVEGIFSKR